MGYTILNAADAHWQPSNQMGVQNTDLAKQLGATTLGARLRRPATGRASTRNRVPAAGFEPRRQISSRRAYRPLSPS